VTVGGAANVYTTCGTEDKVNFLKKLGEGVGAADKVHPINYRTQGELTSFPVFLCEPLDPLLR
jgi:hypothetical protein